MKGTRARLPFLSALSRAAASRELLLYRERGIASCTLCLCQSFHTTRRSACQSTCRVDKILYILPSLELYSSELWKLCSTESVLIRTFVLRIKLKVCGSAWASVVSLQVFWRIVNHWLVLLGSPLPVICVSSSPQHQLWSRLSIYDQSDECQFGGHYRIAQYQLNESACGIYHRKQRHRCCPVKVPTNR